MQLRVRRGVARRAPRAIESEDHFEGRVVRAADALGWCAFHIRFSAAATRGIHTLARHDHACGFGWPDWVFAKPGKRLLYRELKTEVGRVSRHQNYWHNLLRSAGEDVAVWRPSMWSQILLELGA